MKKEVVQMFGLAKIAEEQKKPSQVYPGPTLAGALGGGVAGAGAGFAGLIGTLNMMDWQGKNTAEMENNLPKFLKGGIAAGGLAGAYLANKAAIKRNQSEID
jgi:hypothetical protein